MYDQLQRLNTALPMVRTWIERVRDDHAALAHPVAEDGFARLPDYFSDELLRCTRVATVTHIPFPPIVDLGLIEFADIAQMGLSAITFGDLIFVHHALKTEAVHFHELVHVVQWRTLGVDRFMLTYALGILQHGYAKSPFEVMAYDLQSEFIRGAAIPDLEKLVAAHAHETCAAAQDLFERHGMKMGARQQGGQP